MTTPCGKLIAFEGGDRVGKKTQATRLAERLGGRYIDFPNHGSLTGQAIRGMLRGDWTAVRRLGKFTCDDAPGTAALVRQALMAINRYELAPKINELLNAGTHVVLDRYYLSGIVYGFVDGVPGDWLWQIHSLLPPPDLWILIDIPVEQRFHRDEEPDLHERDLEHARRVRDEYLKLFRARQHTEPGYARHWKVVNGLAPRDAVHGDIVDSLRARGIMP
jgi:dTMP kinase